MSAAIAAIVAAVGPNIPVQLGGGIRDIDAVAEPIYLMDPGAGSYVRLTRELIIALEAGELRF